MRPTPKIDNRTETDFFRHLADKIRASRLSIDIEQGDPQAQALLRVFARYCALIVRQLNRVPDKNHAAFLNVLNLSPMPPLAAQVP